MKKYRVRGFTYFVGKAAILEVEAEDESGARAQARQQGVHAQSIEVIGDRKSATIRAGVVYLIRCGAFHKIGKTSDPHSRYTQLKIQLPEKPELIHEIHTNDIDYVERHWHRRFQAARANGEWFSLQEEDIEEFSDCISMNKRQTDAGLE